MKEYIKKFSNPAAADQYAIKDIPFITSVDGDPIQNLHCNLSGKKLVNVSGIVEVQSAGPEPPEMIDLGLSVKWAKNNIGATCGNTVESWYGGYYAWGETETKSDYSWNTYKFGTASPFTKYNIDVKTVLESADDIATQTYGSNYRMPTKEEIEELIALPNQWVTDFKGIPGLNGRVFTGTNGNTLFIPAAGYCNGESLSLVGSGCRLWSSGLTLDDSDYVYYLDFYSDTIYVDRDSRCYGLAVRPVQNVNNS